MLLGICITNSTARSATTPATSHGHPKTTSTNTGIATPDLWDRLRDLVIQPDTRCVHCVEQAGILPDDTLFHSDFLGYPTGMARAKRVERRGDWFAAALRATAGADLVLADPDNGLGLLDDAKTYWVDGLKFVPMSDLRELWMREQSIALYHHLGMEKGGAKAMIAKAVGRVVDGLGVEPVVLLYRRGNSRVSL